MTDNILMSAAEYWYRVHYHMRIKDHLSEEQKMSVAQRIGELTSREPIWEDPDTDHAKEFPELRPYVSVPMTGLFLFAVLKGIYDDLHGITKVEPIEGM